MGLKAVLFDLDDTLYGSFGVCDAYAYERLAVWAEQELGLSGEDFAQAFRVNRHRLGRQQPGMPPIHDRVLFAQGALERLYNCREGLKFALQNAPDGEADPAFSEKLAGHRRKFIDAMEDDLNTADAIAALFELVRDCNLQLAAQPAPSRETLNEGLSALEELCGVLGLLYSREEASLDREVEELIAARTKARQEKNWAEADRIRDQLREMHIVLEDTPQGVKWHRA